MKAGFFETDITPAIGMEKPGEYYKLYITSIHDPLKVRAVVIDDGQGKIVLIGVDSVSVEFSTAKEIRRKVAECCGLPEDCVLVAASHTHSGGPLAGAFAEDFIGAPDLIRDLALNYSTEVNPEYHRKVIEQAVLAASEANRKREDVTMSIGSGCEDKVAFNRRLRMKNGRVYTHPGKGNPDILEPAGPIDPEVGVIGVWNKQDKFLGCIVNYACHGTTFGGDSVSADWVYYLERTIKGVMGKDGIVVFLNGASGDVTQVNNLSLREFEFGERWANFVGTRVGAEAVKILAGAVKGDMNPVFGKSKKISIGHRVLSKHRLEKSLKIVESGLREMNEDKKTSKEVMPAEWLFAKELLLLDYLVKKQVEVEIQALQIGPAIFLANPAEYFCQFGLDIKKRSPFPFTFVVELANGSIGYVPTPESFLPSGGGYETALTRYSNLEIEAGKIIEEVSLELARKLKPGNIPQPPSIKGFLGPWNYGTLGPDLE